MDKERCIRQHAQTAAMNAKFLLNQQKEGQSIAGIATKSTESQDLEAAEAADTEAEAIEAADIYFSFYYFV